MTSSHRVRTRSRGRASTRTVVLTSAAAVAMVTGIAVSAQSAPHQTDGDAVAAGHQVQGASDSADRSRENSPDGEPKWTSTVTARPRPTKPQSWPTWPNQQRPRPSSTTKTPSRPTSTGAPKPTRPAPTVPDDAPMPTVTSRPTQTSTQPPAPTTTSAPPRPTTWWKPKPGLSFQIQFAGEFDKSIAADVFELDYDDTQAKAVSRLRADGARVMCYINGGAAETWRKDYASFPADVKGKSMANWDGEFWLDIRKTDVLLPIMKERMKTCAAKGFAAVDADNMDNYTQDSGFPLTKQDQFVYNKALADLAHELGLAFALKNDMEQIPELTPHVDMGVNESCEAYNECKRYLPMLEAGKPVFHISYAENDKSFCNSLPKGFTTIFKNRNLDAKVSGCFD